VIDPSALQMVLAVLTGWLDCQERQAVAYLIEENRILRRQLRGQRLQFTDHDRRRLAVVGIGWAGRSCVRSRVSSHRTPSRSLSIITIASEITKDSRIAYRWECDGATRGRDPSASAARRLVELLRTSGVTTGAARRITRPKSGTLRGCARSKKPLSVAKRFLRVVNLRAPQRPTRDRDYCQAELPTRDGSPLTTPLSRGLRLSERMNPETNMASAVSSGGSFGPAMCEPRVCRSMPLTDGARSTEAKRDPCPCARATTGRGSKEGPRNTAYPNNVAGAA
jgi:hypothetical protein